MLGTLGGAEGLETGFRFGSCIMEGSGFNPVHIFLLHLFCHGVSVVFFHVKIVCRLQLPLMSGLSGSVSSEVPHAGPLDWESPRTASGFETKAYHCPKACRKLHFNLGQLPPTPWALPRLGCSSSHLRSWAPDPKPNLCDTEKPGLFTGYFPQCSAYIWAGVQKLLNNNSPSPSMKKETHCVYRYRIWHLKHESTFGLGAPGQGCWTSASLL